MIDRLGQAARALWSSAPLWRGIVVAAAVCTVLAFVIPSRPWTTGGGPPPPFPTPSQNQNLSPPVAAEPADTQQRWSLFMNRSSAADAASPAARRCELLSAALRDIQPADLNWPTTDRTKAHTEATACANEIEASDRRLRDFAGAVQQAGADDGAASTQTLAAAFSALIPLDRDRSLSVDERETLKAGERAAARLAESDRRIAALNAAGSGFSLASPAPAYAALVAATAAVTPFDRARTGEAERPLLDQANAAADRLRASDARLQELRSALGIARTSTEPQIRDRLIAAVAGITEFDTTRGDPSFGQDATEARGLARRFALDAVIAEARSFDAAAATPEQVARLAAMRAALGAVEDMTPEQREALKDADRASIMLADSDRRLTGLLAAAEAWDKDPSPATAPQVTAALGALTPFDRLRSDQPHRQAAATLAAAQQVIALKESGGTVTLAALKELPLFVTSAAGGTPGYVGAFQEALLADGFRLASARETAALALELAGAVRGSRTLSGSQATGLVELTLNAVWVYDGRGFRQQKSTANAGGPSTDIAIDRAYRKAATQLYSAFLDGLEGPAQDGGDSQP
jgi:hypothetical protein